MPNNLLKARCAQKPTFSPQTFFLVDTGIARLEAAQAAFGSVCAPAARKEGNLALGCYSLWLDALPQEGSRGGLVVWAAAARLIPVGDPGDAGLE